MSYPRSSLGTRSDFDGESEVDRSYKAAMSGSRKISFAIASGLAVSLVLASTTGVHAVSDPITKPYGEWTSPITSDLIVAESIRLGEPSFDGDDI